MSAIKPRERHELRFNLKLVPQRLRPPGVKGRGKGEFLRARFNTIPPFGTPASDMIATICNFSRFLFVCFVRCAATSPSVLLIREQRVCSRKKKKKKKAVNIPNRPKGCLRVLAGDTKPQCKSKKQQQQKTHTHDDHEKGFSFPAHNSELKLGSEAVFDSSSLYVFHVCVCVTLCLFD